MTVSSITATSDSEECLYKGQAKATVGVSIYCSSSTILHSVIYQIFIPEKSADMSSSESFIDEPKALQRHLEKRLRNFKVMEESKIEELAKILTFCISVMCKHKMRKTKEPMVVKNLKFRWTKGKNHNKIEDSQPSTEPWHSLILVEKLPNISLGCGSILLDQREILLRGPLVKGQMEAIDGFRHDMKRYLCELKEWQMTRESVKQLRTELLDESYAADGEEGSTSDESDDDTDVEDDVMDFEFKGLFA
ncbi:hypothetical protein IAQ61_005491 [Plenodomus lingam]|uniref:uncharacterized protein n=1 Tax=Leptosphaeria maculans TaxID=5022 RepID=UPI003326DF09|nr:hypothetical protein IAQ61_005491 [Plenodomus lingam]